MGTLPVPPSHDAEETKPWSELEQELSFTDLVELTPPTEGIPNRRKSKSLPAERTTKGRLQAAVWNMRSRSAHASLGSMEGVMLNMYMPVSVGRNTTPPQPPPPQPPRRSRGSSKSR
ncbi:hypothetical protein HPP92_014500 [Vanilla planifolia]|uniref:Uncharacterized protein n=1 Tax=Vanilla planifolia TaxID=51239 RepID=A0A835USS7_VANPL|nr:hypothetical protein HPP92_014500 [Vanilla planifolia]